MFFNVMENYEFIEHTADIGIRVYGKNLEELFLNSARAAFSIITNFIPAEEKTRHISLEAQTLEDLLVNWLNELISSFFAYKFLPNSYAVVITLGSPNILKATVKGDEYDPYSRKVDAEIKAATYHNLKIEKTKEGYKAEIIFDV